MRHASCVDNASRRPCRGGKTSAARRTPAQKARRTGSLLKRFVQGFNDIDTTYIAPNLYNYLALLQNTNHLQTYRLEGRDEDGNRQTLVMRPQPGVKIGPYFGWRWIFLGYTFDVGHPGGMGKKTEFNLSLYSSRIGCDLLYIRNKGNFTLRRATGFSTPEPGVRGAQFPGARTFTTGVNLYCILNHRRFSYPAAFSQSTMQRRSAGSWILGIRYDHQKFEFNADQLPPQLLSPEAVRHPLVDGLRISEIRYTGISASGGYGYNLVFAPGWLLSASVTPSIGYRTGRKEKDGARPATFWRNFGKFGFDVVARGGLVWTDRHWIAGVTAVSYLYDYRRSRVVMNNNVVYINAFFGVNIVRRRSH